MFLSKSTPKQAPAKDASPLSVANARLLFAEEQRQMSRRKGAFFDLRESIRRARLWRLWQTVLSYLRRFRMIAFLLRAIGYLWAALQAGALVLLSTLLFFVLLPPAVAFFLGLSITALSDAKRSLRRMLKVTAGKRIYLLFGADGDFFAANARELSQRPDIVCIAVSPHWLSPRGLGKRQWYVNLRQDGERLFLIRRSFFFLLRKHLPREHTAMIY